MKKSLCNVLINAKTKVQHDKVSIDCNNMINMQNVKTSYGYISYSKIILNYWIQLHKCIGVWCRKSRGRQPPWAKRKMAKDTYKDTKTCCCWYLRLQLYPAASDQYLKGSLSDPGMQDLTSFHHWIDLPLLHWIQYIYDTVHWSTAVHSWDCYYTMEDKHNWMSQLKWQWGVSILIII